MAAGHVGGRGVGEGYGGNALKHRKSLAAAGLLAPRNIRIFSEGMHRYDHESFNLGSPSEVSRMFY